MPEREPFAFLKCKDLSVTGALEFLAWACSLDWPDRRHFRSLSSIAEAIEEQFFVDLQSWRSELQRKLKIDPSDPKAIDEAIEYLAVSEYGMPLRLRSWSAEYKNWWVAASSVRDEFGLQPEKMNLGKIGRPQVEHGIDSRRDDFAETVISYKNSWRYELYLWFKKEPDFPSIVCLQEAQSTPHWSIKVSLQSAKEAEELFQLLKRISRIGALKSIQEYVANRSGPAIQRNASVWNLLDEDIGLFQEVEWTSETTLNASLSAGKSQRLKLETTKFSEDRIEITPLYESDHEFLRLKSLFK